MEEKLGFLWLMFALKPPLLFLLWLVWYASKPPEDADEDHSGEGGTRVDPHEGRRRPPRPRGPHGDPAPLPSPPRRRVAARATRPSEHR